jgi:hypothetical protein
MTVPAQVRDRAKAATDLQKELSEGTTPTETPKEETITPPTGNAGTEPPAPVPPEEDWKSWKHKYDTLRGMYNSQVPQLQATIREANEKISALEAKARTIPPQPARLAPTTSITDKDREDFGDDTIDMMQRAARASVEGEIAELRNTISQLQQLTPKVSQLETRQVLSAEDQYFSRLTAIVPDWNAVNDNPQFHEWLLEPDPLTGVTKQQHLEAAHNHMDYNRVAAFFNTWKALSASVPPPSPTVTTSAASQLERQIAPGNGRSSQPSTEPATITREQVAKFYNDISRGLYRGKDAERAKQEQAIFLAQREGRIVN